MISKLHCSRDFRPNYSVVIILMYKTFWTYLLSEAVFYIYVWKPLSSALRPWPPFYQEELFSISRAKNYRFDLIGRSLGNILCQYR